MSYSMIHNLGQIPPCDKFRLGHQSDGAGHLYNVVCRTPHGMIPGKAKQDKAWYPYGGKENMTKDFMYLQAEHGGQTQLVRSRHPPHGALAEGHQQDGTYYVAVCHTNHGEIPGKAKGHEAWFPWDGKETRTENFSYVIVKQGHGYNPPKHGLQPGMKVHLKSKSHGSNLKIDQNNRVSGTGGNGEWATFMVHHRGGHHGSHHVALSLARHPHLFLAIRNQSLTVGNGGPNCTMKVIGPHPDGTISLESVPHHGQHVGILPNGDEKAPHQTGTGDQSRFHIHNA